MNRLIALLAVALLAGPALSLLWERGESGPRPDRVVRPPAELLGSVGTSPRPQASPPAPPSFHRPEEDLVFRDAAELAWRYVERQYRPSTGLTNSVLNYPYATVWDVASGLAALYCARELGLLEHPEYLRRMGVALSTLRRLPLYREGAYGKNYQVDSGRPAGRSDRERAARRDGYGWSATDLGRLLVWLKIISAADPELAASARAVVERIDFDRVVRDGYLWGESLSRDGRSRAHQEGRLGYEQYAAAGFALWGRNADRALNLTENAREVEVLGVPVLADSRGNGHLTSEPFLLMGLELGWWDPLWRRQAENLLAAQRARYERTGRVTVVSEDALPDPPDYFYYYTVYEDGQPFVVTSLGGSAQRSKPRWVSTKAAFAWYALMPDEYTWLALQKVAGRAADPTLGWSSGVYEESGAPTGSQNINTAAVVLEAALYHQRRRPLLPDAVAARPDAPVDSAARGALPRR